MKIALIKTLTQTLCMVSLLSLSACARYETRYTPPASENGMACVKECLSNLNNCNNNCHNRKLVGEVSDALNQASLTKEGKGQATTQSGPSGDCGCKSEYEACYKSCGGDVKRFCVAHCD